MILKKEKSKTYGAFHFEFVGIFSPQKMLESFPSDIAVQKVIEWTEKFHPKTYFGSYSMIPVSKNNDPFGDMLVLVASEKANQNWYEENKELAKKNNIKKKLPISIKDEKIKKWQKSLPKEIIFPDFLSECKTIEDIKEKMDVKL